MAGLSLPLPAGVSLALMQEFYRDQQVPHSSVGDSQSKQPEPSTPGQSKHPVPSALRKPRRPHPFSELFAFKVLESAGHLRSPSALREVVSMWQFPGIPEAECVWLPCSPLPVTTPFLLTHAVLLPMLPLACWVITGLLGLTGPPCPRR